MDQRSCQSSGRCIDAAPQAFSFDEDRLADAAAGVADVDRDTLLAIARACPAIAISVYDDDGNEVEF